MTMNLHEAPRGEAEEKNDTKPGKALKTTCQPSQNQVESFGILEEKNQKEEGHWTGMVFSNTKG